MAPDDVFKLPLSKFEKHELQASRIAKIVNGSE
jgi:hypothetical protein